ncbi:UNVERIFIED_CONTAM: hypothetical protein K2H54_028433 [Gekko kuhli]
MLASELMHLRLDSVDIKSGGSDCEMDLLDMDSYLGILENARGVLLDCPASKESPPTLALSLTAGVLSSQPLRLRSFGGDLKAMLQEESLRYFLSQDDFIESELFMERNFQFCSRIA